MKYLLWVIFLLTAFSLAACASQPITPPQDSLPQTTPTEAAVEEAQIRQLVEAFGKRLQDVALLAPDAAQELQTQYVEFVSPALLTAWMADPSKAPGRVTSSPWPDRIEITILTRDGADKYVLTSFVIEITSVEAASGGAAARVPVRIVVENVQGHWLITEYTQ